MKRAVLLLVFLVGLLFGTGMLLAVVAAKAGTSDWQWEDLTEPSGNTPSETGVPKLLLA